MRPLIEWSRQQAMSMNGCKSNEMLIGRIHKVKATVVAGRCRNRPSENVQTSWSPCLMQLDDHIKWSHHIDAICSKAAYRLHFLKLLARSGSSLEDLVCFYTTVVRPIVELRLPSLTLKPHCGSGERPGVNSEERCAFCAKRTTR